MPTKSHVSRSRRVLGVIGAVVGTTVTFAAATIAATVVHLDVPVTRRLVATQVNKVLHARFAGDVAVEHIGSLGLGGVSGLRFRVKDPEGNQVLYVDGVRVRLDALDVARSLLFGSGDLVVQVSSVSVDHVDAAIDGDSAGNLRIANAFAERTPTPPTPTDPTARGLRLELPKVALKHAWIHGQAPGAPPVDAELSDLAARAHIDPKITRADLDHVDLVTRGLPRALDPRGRLGAHVTLPSATGKSVGLEAAFDGLIAGIPTAAQAHLDGPKLDAIVDGHDAGGRGMRSTFGEVGTQEEVTVHAEAHGELPRLGGTAHLALGRGTVDVDGHVDVSNGTKADATVALRHIDVHAILPEAPVSDVGLDSHANVTIARSGDIKGDVVLETLPGTAGGEVLPIVKVRGELTNDSAHAIGQILDPRATAAFEASFTTTGKEEIVEGQLRANVADLSRLPGVGATMKGHAVLTAQGTANLGAKTFHARAHVRGGGIAYGAQTVDDLTVVAAAQGTLDHPLVDVGVHAGRIASGAVKVDAADLRGRVEPGAVTVIRDAYVDMVKDSRRFSATVRRVQVGRNQTKVENAVLQGLGAPILADLSRDANEIHVKLDAPDIDLALVALVAGKAKAVRNGHLRVRGDVSLRHDSASGEVHAKVDDLSASTIDGARMNLDATFAGKAIGLTMNAELADAGRFELVTRNVVLAGSPIDAASWRHAHGRAKFDANLDTSKIAALVPREQRPFSELRGQLVIAGTLRRDSGGVPPEMRIHAHTRGLVLAGKVAPEPPHDELHGPTVLGVERWRSEGVDVAVDANVDATSGHGEVAFHAFDQKGTLIAFDAKSDLPYQQMVSEPSKALLLLQSAPLSARLVIPKRALSSMPEMAGTRSMPGTVEAELSVTGTALEPRLDFVAHGRGLRSASLPVTMSSDADVALTYDGEKGDVVAKVGVEKHEALALTAHVDVKARDLLEAAPGQALEWGGSAKVKLASFPLQTVNALADRHVRGHISGEASIDDLHKDAKAHAQIGIEGLKIGRATYKSGNIVFDAQRGKVVADARLEQTDGYAAVHATTDLAWGAALAPSLDPNANVEAHLDAKGFRAAAILPFVESALNELDGRIDANATVKVGPGFNGATMDGSVAFHDGTVQLAALGEEFKNARATVSFQPGGVIKIDGVYMQGAEGELTADAIVRTRGLAIASAVANLHIPKRKALDVATQGQPIGAVSGDVKLAATSSEDGKTMNVRVDVPTLHVALPQKMKSGVQELSERPYIRVGVFRDPQTFVLLPLDKDDLEPPKAAKPVGTIIDLDVRLGEVTVVQGNQARVVLGGNPHIHITNQTQVTGQIQLKQGNVDVQGKKFDIERGTITFQPQDASNPIVVVTAAWTADDGSKIYADFVGPVKTGKVNLRSDPPRPKNEILAMILFGTADGANAAPPPPGRAPDGTTKAAVGVGGGFAAQGLTEAMDDLTGIQATARIDTSRSSNPAPEIEVQLARRVSMAFEHVLGTPPVTEPDTNLAIIDWRFRANWSLETTFGDRGKLATDAVWTKRY